MRLLYHLGCNQPCCAHLGFHDTCTGRVLDGRLPVFGTRPPHGVLHGVLTLLEKRSERAEIDGFNIGILGDSHLMGQMCLAVWEDCNRANAE